MFISLWSLDPSQIFSTLVLLYTSTVMVEGPEKDTSDGGFSAVPLPQLSRPHWRSLDSSHFVSTSSFISADVLISALSFLFTLSF